MYNNYYRLRSMPHANCFVAIYEESMILVSYRTPVLTLRLDHENRKLMMYGTGYYSQTTAKQISKFLRETGVLDYSHYKAASKAAEIIDGDGIIFRDESFYDAVLALKDWYDYNGTPIR